MQWCQQRLKNCAGGWSPEVNGAHRRELQAAGQVEEDEATGWRFFLRLRCSFSVHQAGSYSVHFAKSGFV